MVCRMDRTEHPGVTQMTAIAHYRLAARPSRPAFTGLLRRLLSFGWMTRPHRLDPAALSDHLRRDLGLADGRTGRPRDF